MDIEKFFNNEEKVENFLKAKTEQEARNILESECGKITDEDFDEVKKGFITAVSEEVLGKASGGIDMSTLTTPLAKKVYAVGGVALGLAGVAAVAHKLGRASGYDEGYHEGCNDVTDDYISASKKGVAAYLHKNTALILERGAEDKGPGWFHIVKPDGSPADVGSLY